MKILIIKQINNHSNSPITKLFFEVKFTVHGKMSIVTSDTSPLDCMFWYSMAHMNTGTRRNLVEMSSLHTDYNCRLLTPYSTSIPPALSNIFMLQSSQSFHIGKPLSMPEWLGLKNKLSCMVFLWLLSSFNWNFSNGWGWCWIKWK